MDSSDTKCILDSEDEDLSFDPRMNVDDDPSMFTSSKLVFHSDQHFGCHSTLTESINTGSHYVPEDESPTDLMNTSKRIHSQDDVSGKSQLHQKPTITVAQHVEIITPGDSKKHGENHPANQGNENKERENKSPDLEEGTPKLSDIKHDKDGSSQDDAKNDLDEIVVIPSGHEMDLDQNAAPDFYQDEQILHNPTLKHSSYRHFLKICGFIGSEDPLLGGHPQEDGESELIGKHKRRASSLLLYLYRFALLVFIVMVWLMKFDGLIRLKLVVLEKKFPFTVLNNLVWELRWVLTYLLCLKMVSDGGLQNFLSQLEITHKQWRQNKKKMKYYIILV